MHEAQLHIDRRQLRNEDVFGKRLDPPGGSTCSQSSNGGISIPFPKGTTLAERLVNYRKARGLRQKDFARQLGIDQAPLPALRAGSAIRLGSIFLQLR